MKIDIRELARLGATARIAAIEAERNVLLVEFPELAGRKITAKAKRTKATEAKPRRRKHWTQTKAGRAKMSKIQRDRHRK